MSNYISIICLSYSIYMGIYRQYIDFRIGLFITSTDYKLLV